MTPEYLQAQYQPLSEKLKTIFSESMPADSIKYQEALTLLGELDAVISSVKQGDVNKPVVRTTTITTMKRSVGVYIDSSGFDLKPYIKDKTFTVEYTKSNDEVDPNLIGKIEKMIKNGSMSGINTSSPSSETELCDHCGSEFKDIQCTTTIEWRVVDTQIHNAEK